MKLFILVNFILIGYAAAQYKIQGIDIKQPVTEAQVRCLKAENVISLYIRAYMSLNGGMFDHNACASYKSSSQYAITHVYMDPAPIGSKTGKDQIEEMFTGLAKCSLDSYIKFFWISVVSPSIWSHNSNQNLNFIKDLVRTSEAKNVSIGIYTNEHDWNAITGSANHTILTTGTEPIALWYANAPQSGEAAQNLDNFKPFGGWESKLVNTVHRDARTESSKTHNFPEISSEKITDDIQKEPIEIEEITEEMAKLNKNVPKNYFAVAVGRKLGVFTSWATAEQQTTGFPHNKFKGFEHIEDAIQYITEYEKEFSHQGLTYQLTIGDNVTNYNSFDEMKPIFIANVGATYQRFKREEEAEDTEADVDDNHDANEISSEKKKEDSSLTDDIQKEPIEIEEITEKMAKLNKNVLKNYYAVAHGKKMGVFTSWATAEQQTTRFSRKNLKGFEHIEDAIQYITEYEKEFSHQGLTYQLTIGDNVTNYNSFDEMKPIFIANVGATYQRFKREEEAEDTEADVDDNHDANEISSEKKKEDSSLTDDIQKEPIEIEEITEKMAKLNKNVLKNYYAVAHGKKMGVFTSWATAEQQTTRFSRKNLKGFEHIEDAIQYITEYEKEFSHQGLTYQLTIGDNVTNYNSFDEMKPIFIANVGATYQRFKREEEAEDTEADVDDNHDGVKIKEELQ